MGGGMKRSGSALKPSRGAAGKRARASRSSTGGTTGKPRFLYTFGGGRADGRADMKPLLGGKGANLAEMTSLGVPVPPGFTITTEVCRAFYKLGERWPQGLDAELTHKLAWLEGVTTKGFGNPKNPLLVSVRSGAAVSMPGMMDTILNLGLNDRVVQGLIVKTENPRFAYDAYRRFIQMYGNVVLEIEHKRFEEALGKAKTRAGAKTDAELPAEALKALVAEDKRIVKDATGRDFPDDPMEQLRGAVNAVFSSWNNERARVYRRLNDIPHDMGTAVTVQSMVFGNMGKHSLTGVCFTRDPGTGERVFYGEYLVNAQGEDVVAGIRTPKPMAELKSEFPKIYESLYKIGQRLETHFTDVQDMEFTVEEGVLCMLQTRTGKRTAGAAVAIAADFVREGVLSKNAALLRINPDQIDQLLHPTIDPKAKPRVIAKGLPASPGAAVGKVAFHADRAVEMAKDGAAGVILVREETSPEDIEGMAASQGILTARGGMTCIAGRTQLLTPEGFQPAEELFHAIEDGARPLLLAFDHRTMRTRWRRVIAAGSRRSPTVEIEVSQSGRASGNTLELTPDHKMLVLQARRLFKKPLAACLDEGDFLCLADWVPGSPLHREFPEVDPYLVGVLLTDGDIRLWDRKGSVTFTQKATPEKTAMIATVRASFEQSFDGDRLGYQRSKATVGVLRGRTIQGTVEDFICFRREPAERLARIRDAAVTWVLQLESETDLLRFLAGVADGDGSYGAGRLQLYIGKDELLRGVVIACLRLGIVPQVTRNRAISNVQIVGRLGDILIQSSRLSGTVTQRKYGTKLFSTRSLFQDIVKTVDRQGRLRSAVERNVLYGVDAVAAVLPRCPSGITAELERLTRSGLRMARASRAADRGVNTVYNFEVLAEDELDKNFVAFTSSYTPVLVSNSHAAVVGRGMGKCCVVGCNDITVREAEGYFSAGGVVVKDGEIITLNGSTGEVILGETPLVKPQLTDSFKQLLEWADKVRRLRVRANADTPQDAKVARDFGAEGIGLCRTEHMFFGEERLPVMREMILAQDATARKVALAKLLPFQKQDFIGIFEAMQGLPVTVRLLDPPLHEFLPATPEDQERVAKQLGMDARALRDTVNSLHEINPMLGHRGCRLGITYPEINEMQAQAICEAACELTRDGVTVIPEIMVPLVGHPQEFHIAKRTIDDVAKRTMARAKVTFAYLVGTMIEVPRAAVVADLIAQEAEFFSFGTNDLTQMTFGFSRDDIGKFLPHYLKEHILPADPFMKLDRDGVGSLIRLGIQKGRAARKGLKVGICGEHGGEPSSIEFCHQVGMDYVSCSPYRVPVARLAAAQAALKEKKR